MQKLAPTIKLIIKNNVIDRLSASTLKLRAITSIANNDMRPTKNEIQVNRENNALKIVMLETIGIPITQIKPAEIAPIAPKGPDLKYQNVVIAANNTKPTALGHRL